MTKRYAHLAPTGLQDSVTLLEQEPTGSGTRILTGRKSVPRATGEVEGSPPTAKELNKLGA